MLPPAAQRWVLVFCTAAGALGLWLWANRDAPPTRPAATLAPQTITSVTRLAAPRAAPATPSAAASTSDPLAEQLSHSSLRGTAPDGDWGIDASGQLRPGLALRQRFDYYLSLQGELALSDITRGVEAALRRSHADPAAAQVMALWSRYVQLQQHVWKVVADPSQPATLSAALAERVPVRRAYLGADVADVFYRDEERDFRERVARINAGQTGPARVEVPQTPVLPDAQARLDALRAEQTAWTRRLDASRRAIAQINTNAALSSGQREAAVATHLQQNYTPTEQIRVRALLDL